MDEKSPMKSTPCMFNRGVMIPCHPTHHEAKKNAMGFNTEIYDSQHTDLRCNHFTRNTVAQFKQQRSYFAQPIELTCIESTLFT